MWAAAGRRAARAAVESRREGELRRRKRRVDAVTTADGVVGGESAGVDRDVTGVLSGRVSDVDVGVGLEPGQKREGRRRRRKRGEDVKKSIRYAARGGETLLRGSRWCRVRRCPSLDNAVR
jgi:hypothetical protein